MSARSAPISFRLRLALALGAVIVAAIGLTLLAVGAAVDRVLVAQTAERLEIAAGLLVDRPRTGPPVTELAASDVAQLLGGQGTAVAIIDADGTLLGAADNGAPPEVADARLDGTAYAGAIASGATVRTVVSTSEGRLLIVAAPIRLTATGRVDDGQGQGRGAGPAFVPPGQAKRGVTPAPDATATIEADDPGPANAVAQLAVSLAPVDETIGELRQQLAWLGVLGLAIGLAVAFVITARSTRPLERVVAAAQRVADGDLSARSGVSGPDEVGAVGRAFDTMAERLQAAFEAQRAFAADASHELRTPLTVLGGYLDVLRRGSLPDDEERRLLGAMRREIDRLARLASDLLLLAKLEAGSPALEPRPFDLADLVREQAEAARMLETGVEIAVEAVEPLPVHADPDRIAQVLRNLVENAARHAAPGTPVTVRAFRDGDVAAAQVVNTGEPIDPRELPQLFERFVRGADVTGGAQPDAGTRRAARQSPRAGLGLAISRAIVEASGGTIAAQSDASATRFTFRLPIAPPAGSQPVLSEQPAAPL